MFVLRLNPMRAAQVEITENICKADTREALEALLERESVEPYRDGRWAKHFRQGGPLEWFNPPCEIFGQGIFDIGNADVEAMRARENFEAFAGALCHVSSL